MFYLSRFGFMHEYFTNYLFFSVFSGKKTLAHGETKKSI
jgi:hypothetical protein